MKNLRLSFIGIITLLGLCAPAAAENIDTSIIALEQSAADRQREAERILKEAEAIRRENNSGSTYSTPREQNLQNQTNSEVDRLRNSFGNDQKVRESRERLERLRQERIRLDRSQQYYPAIIPGFIPAPYSPLPEYSEYSETNPTTVIERFPDLPAQPAGQLSDREFNPSRPDLGTASVSVGFRNGAVNPAVGYRFGNTPISVEVGAVFNQDSLPPGTLNDFSVPASLLQQFPTGFDNLGRRNLTPQIGADILGHLQVAPSVSLYGGLGVYFQGEADITRSNITTDLFRQTSNTDVSLAVSGGADVKISDSLRIGGGYHSLRGITAKVGLDF